MAYKYNWRQSPNYTNGSLSQRYFGRARVVTFGAGHWWNWPHLGLKHDNIVNVFMNRGRQASSHDVVSAGRVTGMVRRSDVSWATGKANPYTYSIEVDPVIMYRFGWKQGYTAARRKEADRVFETLAERIADLGMSKLKWRPHNSFPGASTQCNPIPWDAVMKRAKEYHNMKYGSKPTEKPKTAQVTYKKYSKPKTLQFNKDAWLWSFDKTSWAQFGTKGIKKFKKGNTIDIYGEAYNKDLKATYLMTEYSFKKKLPKGFSRADLDIYIPKPKVPEWIENRTDHVGMLETNKNAVVYNLETLKDITTIPKGTRVEIAQTTTVKGVGYHITKWSADRSASSGIKVASLSKPSGDNKKPAWFEAYKLNHDAGIEFEEPVEMVARADSTMLGISDGKESKLNKGSEVDVLAKTEVLGDDYFIAEIKSKQYLIRLVDLEPVEDDFSDMPDGSVLIGQPPKSETTEILNIVRWIKKLLERIFK